MALFNGIPPKNLFGRKREEEKLNWDLELETKKVFFSSRMFIFVTIIFYINTLRLASDNASVCMTLCLRNKLKTTCIFHEPFNGFRFTLMGHFYEFLSHSFFGIPYICYMIIFCVYITHEKVQLNSSGFFFLSFYFSKVTTTTKCAHTKWYVYKSNRNYNRVLNSFSCLHTCTYKSLIILLLR